MSNSKQSPAKNIVPAFALSSGLTFLFYLLQADIGISLADEGFLWYGTIATAGGQIPFRDFNSYDPGRYLWTAGWSFVLGDGIMALRLSTTIFKMIGLGFGLLALRRVISSWRGLLLAGLFLELWMFPRFKSFEHGLAMMAVYFCVWLIENPSPRRHFIVGIFVGLAAFFGRNHGLYNFLAFFTLILFVWHKVDSGALVKRVVWWGSGIVVGYSPLLFMLALVPGFRESFWYIIVASAKYPNLPHAPLWPWAVDFSRLGLAASYHYFVVGVIFLLFPVFYLATGFMAFRSSGKEVFNRRLLIASVFVGIFYSHHFIARSDVNHLAQAIHPLLIAIICLPCIFAGGKSRTVARGIVGAVCLILSLAAVPVNPVYSKLRSPEWYVEYDVLGDRLWLPKQKSTQIDCIKQLNEHRFKEDDNIFIAPMWTTFYPILKRQSPVWGIYFIRPLPEELQRSMIVDMEKNNVNWVILGDFAYEDKDENRFSKTHAFMWRHIIDNYEPVPVDCLPPYYRLLKKNEVK